MRHILQNIRPGPLKSVKVIKNEGSLRNCHNQEETKETGLQNIKRYPSWDPGTEKGN